MRIRGICQALLSVGLFLLPSGCRSYVEELTPSGTVPPPPPPRAFGSSFNAPESGAAQVDEATASQEKGSDDPIRVASFRGHPRIALFVNRRLVGDAEDWRGTGHALVLSQDRWTPGEGSPHEAARTTIHEAERTRTDVGLKELPETWLWALEDGFAAPLEQAGAQLVDLASIMRLTALDNAQPASERSVEMTALKGHADIVVQVLVGANGRDRRSPEVRGIATEVSTGAVLARANTRDWPWSRRRRLMTVRVNSEGYVAGPEQGSLRIQSIARELSRDLTDHLCRAWEREHVD